MYKDKPAGFKLRHEKREIACYTDILGKSVLNREDFTCQGLEWGHTSEYRNSSKAKWQEQSE